MKALAILFTLALLGVSIMPVRAKQPTTTHTFLLIFLDPPKEGDSLEVGNATFLYTDDTIHVQGDGIRVPLSETAEDAAEVTTGKINLRPLISLCTAEHINDRKVLLTTEEESLNVVSHSERILVEAGD